MTARDVTDVNAETVADPFIVRENDNWFMFLEVLNADNHQGDTAYAISKNGLDWVYKKVVLDEPFHLSYPCVFKWKNEYYMIPSHAVKCVRLYKAVDFPEKWSLIATLLSGENFTDSTILRYRNIWWLFVETNPYGSGTLRLYYANDLLGPWKEHPKSAIVRNNRNISRPAGRLLEVNGKIIRVTQDCYPTYGRQVSAFEIRTLSTTEYEEKEIKEKPYSKGQRTWLERPWDASD